MDKIRIYYIVIFLIGLVSCADKENIHISKKVITFTIKTDIPYSSPTRNNENIVDDAISDLSILLFDEDGHFIQLIHGTPSDTSGDFEVTLPQSKEKRIIHFVAGFDWNTISISSFTEKSEHEIIPSLSIEEGITFWSRHELPSGISEDCLTGERISLTRNLSKVTIKNQEARLQDPSFAIYNKPNRGTVAPFNLEDYTFTLIDSNNEAVITEPAGMEYNKYDTEFLPTDGSTPSYLFERTNFATAGNLSEQSLFIIIKGKYENDNNYCYYKIELYDKETLKLLNILRNYWYKMVITEVGFKGYDTLEEALNSPASNNLTASVVLEEYPSITDKEYALIVEKTAVIFIRNGENLSMPVIYKKLIDGTEENDKISIYEYKEQTPNNPVFRTTPSYSSVTGLLTGEINDILPGTMRTAIITMRGGDLLRKVKVSLAAPFEFDNAEFTPYEVEAIAGSPLTLSFYIPGDVKDYLPFTTTITANWLSSATNKLEASVTSSGWEYRYKVEHTGRHELNFITNSPASAEAVKLEAEIFAPTYPDYKNVTSEKYNFSNVKFTPDRAPFFAGHDAKLQFTVATTSPVTITNRTLEFIAGQENLTYEQGSKNIIFTPPAIGEHTIHFKTTKDNNGDTIQLKSADHHTKTYLWRNELISLSGFLTLNGRKITYGRDSLNADPPIPKLWIGNELFYNQYITHLVFGMKKVYGSFYVEGDPDWGKYTTQIESYMGDSIYIGLTTYSLITPTGTEGYGSTHTAITEKIILNSPNMVINHDFHYPN